jgi:hypothetical protein
MAIRDAQFVNGQYVQTSNCPIKVVQMYFVLKMWQSDYDRMKKYADDNEKISSFQHAIEKTLPKF